MQDVDVRLVCRGEDGAEGGAGPGGGEVGAGGEGELGCGGGGRGGAAGGFDDVGIGKTATGVLGRDKGRDSRQMSSDG